MPVLDPLLVGGLARYGGIAAETVAVAIVALAGRVVPGRFIHQNRALVALAATLPAPATA
jgi:hypothetical protein